MRGLLAPLIKLVIFLVVTSLATYVLAVTIANSSFGATNTYKADFAENQPGFDLAGLNLGDDVRIAGVRVGTVQDMQLKYTVQKDPNTGKELRQEFMQVTFTVQKSATLTKSDMVILRYRNLIGQRYLDIEQGTGNPNAILKPGGELPQANTQGAVDLTVLFNGFTPLTEGLSADQINQLSMEIIQTLQGEGGALDSLLKTVADLTNSLADKDQLIGEVIDNLSGVLTAINQHNNGLSQLIVQLQSFLSGLASDRNTIGNAIDGINNLATSTSGLLEQARAPLARDIKDITGLVANLNKHSSDVQFVLTQLPPTVAGLIRTASYGSWFNFYLCSVSATVTFPGSAKPLSYKNLAFGDQRRCS